MKKTLIKTAFTLLIAFLSNYSIAQQTSFIGPEKGTLIIVGGGNVGPEIWAKFVEKAGGTNAKIIYVPTAGDDSTIAKNNSTTVKRLKELGVNNITVLHTRDPKVANTENL